MSAKTALLDAAASLATREGVTALGVERIVQEAGVSKGSFFYHFSTKEMMVRALLDHVATDCMQQVNEAVAGGARFTDALIDMVVREVKSNGALISVLVVAVSLDSSLRPALTARGDDWRRRMIEDGLTPEHADLVRLAIDGAMIGTVLYDASGRDERAARAECTLRALVER